MGGGLLREGGGFRVGAETRAGLADTPDEPHLGTHTSVLLGGLGSRPGKERRRAPLVCSWTLSRCGQGRVVILQMWEASGAWELYSARRPLASWVGFPSLGGGVGRKLRGRGRGDCDLLGFPPAPAPKFEVDSRVCSPPPTWSSRPGFLLTQREMLGGGDQVLTPPPPPAGWRHNKEIPAAADVRGAE